MGLSVIVITRNEENDIGRCLESVKNIAQEIIVVDSGSTDRTLEVVRSYTSKIFTRDWAGYSAQKQYAMDQATQEWVLNIDADERVSDECGQEIKTILSQGQPQANGFSIPFHHYFLGQRLHFGGAQGERHIRLFKRGVARYGDESVHEGIQVSGDIGYLRGHIDHFSYKSLEDYLNKCNVYTSMIANKKYASGQRFHFYHHFRLPYEFVVRYVLKFGFLDGAKGLVYAVLSSYYVWLKFMKLKECEEKHL